MLSRIHGIRGPTWRWVRETRIQLSSMAFTFSSQNGSSKRLSSENLEDLSPTPAAGNIAVKWLAAGVDPVDLAAVAGESSATAFRPNAEPLVGGTEGVGLVTAVGKSVTTVEPGDRVVPIKMGLGTWREACEVEADRVMRVPSSVRTELAATLPGSPCTAMRLLSDFGSLREGDVVVHSAGGSAVGTALVQMGSARGLRMVSIVSEKSRDYAPTVERLKLLGAEVAIGESYLKTAGMQAVMEDLPPPKVAFHGSSPQACAAMASLLPKGCTVVTYCPGVVDSTALQQNGLSESSFSLADWLQNSDREHIEHMVHSVAEMMETGSMKGWLQRVKFEDLALAIEQGGKTQRKLVAIMDA